MTEEIKINKLNKSIAFINNGIAYSQFGISDEILDLITNLQQENEKLRLDVRYWENKWQNTKFANNQVKVLQDTIIKSANNTNKAMEQTEIYKSRCKKANELLKTIYKALPGTYNQLLIEIDNYLQGSDENE